MTDFLYLTLKVDATETAVEAEEPNDYIYEYEGEILSVEDDDKRKSVGRFRVFYADLDAAVNAGTAPFDVFDWRSETAPYVVLYDAGSSPVPAAIKAIGEEPFFFANLLILDRLELLPEFRGRGLGLLILRRLIERFSAGTGVVAMKPFPLQFEVARHDGPGEWSKALALETYSKDKRATMAKLQRYYAKLGFKKVAGTDLMIRATEDPLPKLEALIPKATVN